MQLVLFPRRLIKARIFYYTSHIMRVKVTNYVVVPGLLTIVFEARLIEIEFAVSRGLLCPGECSQASHQRL